MTDDRKAYLLPLSDAEAARLHAQAHYLDVATNPLLRRYVRPGMHCVELGCGLGASTETIRQTLGRAGSLTVVDQGAAFLDYVAERLKRTGNAGAEFVTSAAESYAFPAALDLVFGRAVLHHTTDPAAIYQNAAAALEPGGLLIFQEPAMHGIFRHELPEPVERLWRWYLELGARSGFHFDVGDDLAGFARDAELDIVELAGFEPFLVSDEDRSVCPVLLDILAPSLTADGIASQSEIAAVAAALTAVAADSRPIPYVPFIQAVAMRPLHPRG